METTLAMFFPRKIELIHKLAKGAFVPNRAGNNKKAA